MNKGKDTASEEIKSILQYLGREAITGQFRDVHLGQVLIYLQQWQTGDWRTTISRLALRLGMTARGIRENYLEGLEAENIIGTARSSDSILWSWVGLPDQENNRQTSLSTEREKKKENKKKKGGD